MTKIKDGIRVRLNNTNFFLPEQIADKIDAMAKSRQCAKAVVLRDIVCEQLNITKCDDKLRSNGYGKRVRRTTIAINKAVAKECMECVDLAMATVYQRAIVSHFN